MFLVLPLPCFYRLYNLLALEINYVLYELYLLTYKVTLAGICRCLMTTLPKGTDIEIEVCG